MQKALFVFILCVASVLSLTRAPNQQAPSPSLQKRAACSTYKLTNNGGTVIGSGAKVFFIYTGEAIDSDIQSALSSMVKDMSGSPYLTLLKQYSVSSSISYSGSATLPIALNTQLSSADLLTKLTGLFNAGTIAFDPTTLYYFILSCDLVVSDIGGSCSVWCGFHSSLTFNNSLGYYAVNADCSDCYFTNSPHTKPAKETKVASHEIIEWLTDPLGSAWLDSTGFEIGDICNNNAAPATWNGNTYYVNPVFDDATQTCIVTPGGTTYSCY